MTKSNNLRADTVIVLDFETTGLSPDGGDRAIEIGAVRVEGGRITDRYQSLMNPGQRISGFIEDYTGITNSMLKAAPPCKVVMAEFSDFIEDYNLVAHNASFDSRFLQAELRRLRRLVQGKFACSMLLARRMYQHAPNHKLGTLVAYHQLPNDGTFHRALADAEMTTHLWLKMLSDLTESYGLTDVPFTLMQKIGKTPKASVVRLLKGMVK
ncbi:MAG: 3'-5' exonuclease [Gammaproteobacteria bacterium]|nr:3'-5' exonuclease [Gammaproteobacteria bacterium]